MSLARVQFFSVSLDGFGTGEGLTRDEPFGHAGDRLHEWMFTTRWWHQMVGEPGGSAGIDDAFLRLHDPRGRRGDHGRREVRLPRMARGPAVAGLVGARAAVPHTGLRAHPSHAPVDRDGGRYDLPFHRMPRRPRRSRPPAKLPADRTCASAGVRPRSATSLPHDSSTTCMSRSSRSCLVEGFVSGTGWRASRRTTRSRRRPRPAGSPT